MSKTDKRFKSCAKPKTEKPSHVGGEIKFQVVRNNNNFRNKTEVVCWDRVGETFIRSRIKKLCKAFDFQGKAREHYEVEIEGT
eukprot:UN04352